MHRVRDRTLLATRGLRCNGRLRILDLTVLTASTRCAKSHWMHVGDSLGDPQPPRAAGWGDRSNSRVDVSETLDWTRQRDDLQGHPSQVSIAPRIFASGIACEDQDRPGFDFGAISALILGCRCDKLRDSADCDGCQCCQLNSTRVNVGATADADAPLHT